MKVSFRRCIGCRVSADKSGLLRVVLGQDGVLRFDEQQGVPGRGAYLHREARCVLAAGETGRLAHAFRVEKGRVNVEKSREVLGGILRTL